MMRDMAGKGWEDASESLLQRSGTEIKNNSEGD